MAVNLDKPKRWKDDVAQSVDFYNDWFMRFAPATYRQARQRVTKKVEDSIRSTGDLSSLTPEMLKASPNVLPMLRMATAPPIAVDRLSGLAYVNRTLINRMEKSGKLPTRITDADLNVALVNICEVIKTLLDYDVFPWVERNTAPTGAERRRAATIVADRLTGATADPIMRNAQEKRQLDALEVYLGNLGYKRKALPSNFALKDMEPGTFTFRQNVIVMVDRKVNIPIDAIVQPWKQRKNRLPLLIEAKSAGDFANTNKRRKEEATKMRQLRETYGREITFILFLNGYFDTPYLGYEAAEGIDWVWEHRIGDLREFGI